MRSWSRGGRRRAFAGAAALVVAAGAAGALFATGSGATPAGAATITSTSCAASWTPPRSGRRTVTVVDRAGSVVGVELIDASGTEVVWKVGEIAPGASRSQPVVLEPGGYRWSCAYLPGGQRISPVRYVRGEEFAVAARKGPRLMIAPVTLDELQPAVDTYRAGVVKGLSRLARDTDLLDAALRVGDLAAVRRAWLVSHLDYERLGAAYDTFGKYATEIDGRPNGLPLGTSDPHWTGLLRLEYGIWHGQPLGQLRRIGDALVADVHDLVGAFPGEAIPPNDVALRTHEILENTLQFELTGEEDEGSHTALATASANVEGTQMALAAVAPLLQVREPSLLGTARRGLAALAELLLSYRHGGAWTPLQALSQSERERIDSSVSELLEQLSPIPDVLELSTATDADSD